MQIEKIVSGGQNGVDQAGLRAAKACGIATGGWLPNGCITLDGPRLDLLVLYDMQEHPKKGYSPRTEQNVRDSWATVRFAKDFKSAGEKCTLKAIKWCNKPYFDIDIKKTPNVEEFVDWLCERKIRVLNVAGNSEQTAPGIGDIVYDYMVRVLTNDRLRAGS